MMTNELQAVTALLPDDELAARLRVVEVRASDHKHYGRHDLVTVELAEPAGDLPAGLRFAVRRPHDGTTDLRSEDRKKRALRKTATVPLPEPSSGMPKAELIALADARGIELPKKATKVEILGLLTA